MKREELPQVQLLKLFQAKWETTYKKKWRPMSYQYKQAWDAVTVPEGFEPYDEEDFNERINTYFARRDDWIVGCRHNFSVFCKHFEKWVPELKQEAKPVRRSTYWCPKCSSQHSINDACPPQLSLVSAGR